MWTLAFGYHEDRTPTPGYAATREDAMAAFAKRAARAMKRKPRACRAFKETGHESRDQGALDAPILSRAQIRQGANRVSAPTPPGSQSYSVPRRRTVT
jgi:hypothetical protein